MSAPLQLGSVLDAIVVGIDMIVKKLAQGKKGNIRLSLITTTENSIRDPDTGTVEEQVDNIAKQMSEQSIKLEATIVRIGQQTAFLDSKTQQKNEALLRRFESQAQAEVSIMESSMSLLGAMKPRNVTPTTLYRGDLELTPSMTVKVQFFSARCTEESQAHKLPCDIQLFRVVGSTPSI
jgi:ATP-dependent DNA helicase 2 subunit 2